MLSPTEKILFGLLVAICLTATYTTFSQMYQIVMRGEGKLDLSQLPQRIMRGILALLSQGRMIRHRRVSSAFHYFVAYGFIYLFSYLPLRLLLAREVRSLKAERDSHGPLIQ